MLRLIPFCRAAMMVVGASCVLVDAATGQTAGQTGGQQNEEPKVKATSVYDFVVKDVGGKEVKLAAYKDSVWLIVNVASK